MTVCHFTITKFHFAGGEITFGRASCIAVITGIQQITSIHFPSLEGALNWNDGKNGESIGMPHNKELADQDNDPTAAEQRLAMQDDDTTTAEQRLAMQLVLEYFKIRSGLSYGEMAGLAKIPPGELQTGAKHTGKTNDAEKTKDARKRQDAGRHINNFRNQGTCPYVMRLKRYLENQLITHPAFRNPPQYVVILGEVLKGNACAKPLIDYVFSNVVEEGHNWEQRIAKIYGGAWFIIRYAAGILPGDQSVTMTPGNPFSLYSIMDVQPSNPYLSNNGLPCFTVHYRPHRNLGQETSSKIFGHILSLGGGEQMMFIGYEESHFPLVIGAIQVKSALNPPKDFPGFVLRRFEQGAFLCGYCRFVRPRSNRTIDELLSDKDVGRIGIMTRSEMVDRLKSEIPNIAEIMDELRKSGENDGTSMLKL
jgi:hypothetical protein